MPSYSVEVSRTQVHTVSISVTGADEDAAREKAEKMCEDAANGQPPKALASTAEWEDDNITYEVNAVDEE